MPTYNTAFQNAFIDRETTSIEGELVRVVDSGGTTLAETTIAADFFEDAGVTTDGEAEGLSTLSLAVTTAGTATGLRVFTSGTAYVEFTVTITSGGGDVEFPKVALNIGDSVNFDLFKLVFQS